MKYLLPPAILLCLLATPLMAAELSSPALVADFFPDFSAEAILPSRISAAGRVYFAGNREATGNEPWVSDGTPERTHLLADLCPGPCSSNPTGFTENGDKVIFLTTFESTTTVQVYEEGEVKPLLILPGYTATIGQLAGEVYFTSFSGGSNSLYRSDGTPAGTKRVMGLCSGPYCDPGGILGIFGEALYVYRPSDLYTGSALFRVLPGGNPTLVLGFDPFSSPPLQMRAIDADRVTFFLHTYDTPSTHVFITDGTPDGTQQIDDGTPASQADDTFAPVVWRGRLYYHNLQLEIVKTNGQPNATEAAPEVVGLSPRLLSASENTLFYQAWDGGNTYSLRALGADGQNQVLFSGEGFIDSSVGRLGERRFFTQQGHLWASDGTQAGTKALPDLRVSDFGGELGNRLIFAANPTGEAFARNNLWKSDGTSEGTSVILTEFLNPISSRPESYRLGTDVVADPAASLGSQALWRIDPETLARSLVDPRPLSPLAGSGEVLFTRDLDTRSWVALHADHAETLEAPPPAYGFRLAADGTLFFFDGETGEKMWSSDGSAAGTRALFEVAAIDGCPLGAPCANLRGLMPSGDHLYFGSPSPPGSPRPFELYSFDLESQDLKVITPPDSATWSVHLDPAMIALPGNRVAFLPSDRDAYRLWQTNGGSASPQSFADLGVAFSEWVAAGDHLFVATRSYVDLLTYLPVQAQLRVSDLTPEGTFSLLSPTALTIDELTPVGDHVFYRLQTSGQGSELGFSDGTPGGTSSLDLRPGLAGSYPRNLFAVDAQRVVFSASADDAGDELWISDGTREGTFRLTDLAPGNAPSSPSHFTLVGSRLFFQADDGLVGRELWALDLPTARPACPADRLCLHGDRFEVKVRAMAPDGVFEGKRAFGTSESGIFTFFTPNNWEFLVKVLDGCALNDQFWVYASAATDVAFELEVTDRASGRTKSYTHAAGQAAQPILDSAAFATCELDAPAAQYPPAASPADSARRCEDDLAELCLGERFRVAVTWQTAEANGKAHPVASGSADSGLFTFFSPSNWELMVKVLDGCALNGRHWVFAAGTTDVGWTLTVKDLETGESKTYENPLGHPSATLTDTSALGGCS